MKTEHANNSSFPACPVRWPHITPVSVSEWSDALAAVALPGQVLLLSAMPPGLLRVTSFAGGTIAHIELSPQHIQHQTDHLPDQPVADVLVHIVLEGTGEMEQAGQCISFEGGDITFRSVGLPSRVSFGQFTRLIVARLPAHYVTMRGGERVLPGHIRHHQYLAPLIRHTAHCLLESIEQGDNGHMSALQQSLIILLASAYRQQKACLPILAKGNITRWEQATAFINQHITDHRLSMKACAQAMGISPRYLHRVFAEKEMLFSHYVQEARLNMAKWLLAHFPLMSVSSIAYECGFASVAHFSRCFRKEVGIAASHYRKQL